MLQITSVQNPLVKHLVKLRQNRDYRYAQQRIVIEGIKPITEVCGQLSPKVILTYDLSLIPPQVSAEEIVIVNEAVMKKISGATSPEGLIAELEMPKSAELTGVRYLIALDGINDPGNLGTILRTALALGWEGAFILEETCDPFNEKALRAARGATFRLPLAWGNWSLLKKIVQNNDLQPLVADVKGTPLKALSLPKSILLVLSNEAQGVSEQAKQLCTPVTIPMPGAMESLNVSIAAGILMFYLK